MATQVQNRRGTTAEHSTFTGANGELTVDTTKRTLVVHDGATAGGRPLLREDQSNLPTSAPTTGIYNASGSLAISTGGSGRLFVDASGNVGIADSTPQRDAGTTSLAIGDGSKSASVDLDGTVKNYAIYNGGSGQLGVFDLSASTERITLTSAGLVGVGDTSPDSTVTIKAAAAITPLKVSGPSSEFLRCDQQGRLLVGTSSSPSAGLGQYALAVVQGYAGSTTGEGILSIARGKAATALVNTDTVGQIAFTDNAGNTFAKIVSFVDGTVSSTSDLPGALSFSTTADGASSPTPRMTIDSSGRLLINTTGSPGNGNETLGISSVGDGIWIDATGAGGTGIVIDRTAADGDLINFLQAGAQEGVISVSGTTVTYGGGHLARWSQLPNNEDPSTILKGTVMSNLDEMCEWGDEDNEQLNKTKISDVEGDKNVAGVFVSTSFNDDGPLDFFVGMTGDMVIRIAAGVTVERGDLLMSAGDGTAKPQGDDIIRSKTIAKVTSTNVTCTYDDGSYCVPCVLMAC